MKNVYHSLGLFLLFTACSYGQMTVISGPMKDPDVKPEQETATIVHYEKMRTTARQTIRVLAMALENSDGSSKMKLNEAINNEQDIVEWANWCVLALRDKTADARACVYQPEVMPADQQPLVAVAAKKQ
jgi:hypothetical protein